jgi:hypothetical protein
MEDENPPSNKPPGSPPNSLQNTTRATPQEITAHLTALGTWFFAKEMTEGQRKVLLRQMCEDLAGRSEPEIAHACKRWRTGTKAYFPSSGQLLELMKNPYADPPNKHREIFGGGCRCAKCVSKTPREGFFKAPLSDYARDEATRAELNAWTLKQITPSRLNDDELHQRFLMTQELVRDHGWDWEAARRKIMVERTRELYPEFRTQPSLGTELPS